MSDKYGLCSGRMRRLEKKTVAGVTGILLKVPSPRDLCRPSDEFQTEVRREAFDQALIRIAFAPAKLVVEMGDNKMLVKFLSLYKVVESEDEAYRISTTRHRDDRPARKRQVELAPLGDQAADEFMHLVAERSACGRKRLGDTLARSTAGLRPRGERRVEGQRFEHVLLD